jgi:hypothetical protein
MQRNSLDKKSARRIAAGRIGQYLTELIDRAVVLERKDKPSENQVAATSAALKAVQGYFGPGLLTSGVDKTAAFAFGFDVVDDHQAVAKRYALSVVLLSINLGSSDDVRLIVFSGHALERAMQRTGHVEPVQSLLAVCTGLDLRALLRALDEGSEREVFEIETATGLTHCVMEAGALICKTFIDAPGQGPMPIGAAD